MSELITQFTSLPNLHPALVHFPIALLPAAVLFDLLSHWRERDWLAKAATVLYGLAALGAWAAYEAGEDAADSLGVLVPQIQLHVNEHSDFGHYTFWLLVALALVRIGLDFWDRDRQKKAPRIFVLFVALGGVGLLFRTADLGGGLVYQHGLAVAKVDEHGSAEFHERREESSKAGAARLDSDVGTAASRLVTGPNGALEWRPLAGDREALGSILALAEGSDPSAISWVEADGDARGLSLAIDGEALLVLPGSHGDVQVELEVALGEFGGELGPAHHVRSAKEAGVFTLDVPSTEFILGSVEGGTERELDRAVEEVTSDTVHMTVSAIGRHLKGLLGDKTVVHGHEPAMPDGACGILLRGNGTVRVLSMKVTPATG